MPARTFKVAFTQSNKTKEVESYFVTDAHGKEDLESRPKVVVFPISQAFDKDIQDRRANDYCKYLNKLAEAAEEAYEQNKLITILKA